MTNATTEYPPLLKATSGKEYAMTRRLSGDERVGKSKVGAEHKQTVITKGVNTMAENRYDTYKDVSKAVLHQETGLDNGTKNLKVKQYQYECALYETIAGLFESVICRSMNLENLRLYLAELPIAGKDDKSSSKITKEKVLSEMSELVRRDVTGKIIFPQINICAVESTAILENDGSHTFIFTDGIYGFSVRLKMAGHGHPMGIEVKNLKDDHAAGSAA